MGLMAWHKHQIGGKVICGLQKNSLFLLFSYMHIAFYIFKNKKLKDITKVRYYFQWDSMENVTKTTNTLKELQ